MTPASSPTGDTPSEIARMLGHAYIPVNNLKATREALCVAQSALTEWARLGRDVNRVPHWVDRVQALIDQIDVHRPLGSDGKHGNRHTPTCGCEDK
jgi:hypothetical protein